jgi:demethylspheroidene O-methyltransferase
VISSQARTTPKNGRPAKRAFDWFYSWRDQLLTSAGFRQWALRFPLTRLIARRNVSDLFDLCASFVYSQILFACVRLNIFDFLHDGPKDLDQIAQQLNLPRSGAERLVLGASALKLLEDRGGGRYGLGPLGAALIHNPGVVAMIEHHHLLYADLADPVGLLRQRPDKLANYKSQLGSYWAYAAVDQPDAAAPHAVQDYSGLMAASQSFIADDVLAAYPMNRHRLLLDIGGGAGAFAIKAAEQAPHLKIEVFDLPSVAELANLAFARAGLAGRAFAIGGDFHSDTLPKGADVATLIRVVHDHDDDAVLRLLRAARLALAPGGVLVLAEPMSDTSGGDRIAEAYFGFYLLAMGSGRPRSFEQISSLLKAAGFQQIRQRATHTPILVRVIEAQ